MNNQATQARLAVKQGDGLLEVGLGGDWIARAGLPDIGPVQEKMAGGSGVKALAFETRDLGRWNSGLVTFILKCHDLCERNKVEFRAQTLPAGVTRLIQLSQAVPEKKDAARS